MVRKTRAKLLATATALLVVGMAAAFAALHDAKAPQAPAAAVAAGPAADEAGRRAFERLNCGMCHSLAGAGNPAGPLDGVGARLDRAQLRAWTTGSGAAREQLPASAVRRKQAAAADPDLEALLDYLQRSK
jgi:hypothetical protein